jgi:NhaA family Na+:H+ antiporter
VARDLVSGSALGKKRSRMELLQEFSTPLILGVIVAMGWANLAPASYDYLVHESPFGEHSHVNVQFLMNDILMALFSAVPSTLPARR